MTSFSVDSFINSSIVDVICQYVSNITTFLTSAVGLISSSVESPKATSQSVIYAFENFHSLLNFDDFQIKLLKGFLFLLLCNLILIFIFWKIYGNRICERFMKPATNKAIEELKASVYKLKLPKEHSPRI